MQEAVNQAAADGSAIMVIADPKTREEAQSNFCAFANGQRKGSPATDQSSLAAISSMPRIAQCYGWLEFDVRTMNQIPERNWPDFCILDKRKGYGRRIYDDTAYTGIVYEYIEDDHNDPVVVQEMAKFLWLAGFSIVDCSLARNWRSSVLVDHCDIVHPNGYAWRQKDYGMRPIDEILQD